MDISTLNPKIMPGDPMNKSEHARRTMMALVVAAIAIVIGIAYWYIATRSSGDMIEADTPNRQLMLERLRNSDVPPPSNESLGLMLEELRKADVPEPSTEVRSMMIEQLRNSQ